MTLDAALPTVVFVSQLGTGGDSWKPVIDRLTSGAQTFTYDRPGTGTAPPRLAPNPPLPYSSFARELCTLLDDQGVTGPVVLAGHSFGSLISRAFASANPGRTVGMVHVDGSIPRMRFGSAFEPAGIADPVDGAGAGATTVDIVSGEIEVVGGHLPTVPSAIVARRGGWSPGWPELADRLWTAYQRQLARMVGGPLVVPPAGTTHQIPDEVPGLVAYVVDRIVDAAASGRGVRLDGEVLRAHGATVDAL